MSIPYATASSGTAARGEIQKVLQHFGCESVGFMDDFTKNELLLAFTYRGRQIQLRASAQGWANQYLKENPWSHRRRDTRHDYEQKALKQGQIAINSILRDWIKGQMTAVECGIFSFEGAFMPHMLTNDGRTLLERAGDLQALLPAPDETPSLQGETE